MLLVKPTGLETISPKLNWDNAASVLLKQVFYCIIILLHIREDCLMNPKLLTRAVLAVIGGFLMVALPLFWAAGTYNYANAWLLIGVLFIPMLIMGIVMIFKAPDLLEKRLRNKESEGAQKIVILLSFIMFEAGFYACGHSYRTNGVSIPFGVSVVFAVVFLIGYALYAEVMRENAYLSRTIEVQEGQKVVDTGLYAIVRHPMYFATVLMFCSMPVILGSLFGTLIFLVYPFIIAGRIKNEEKVLLEGLEGYSEYLKKVKWRLLPFIW